MSTDIKEFKSQRIDNTNSIHEISVTNKFTKTKSSSRTDNQVNGKAKDLKLIPSTFNIICQYKAKQHDSTFVFCEDCHIYFCSKCDHLYHSASRIANLIDHVRNSVVGNSCTNYFEDFSVVNVNNMMPSIDGLQLADHFESISVKDNSCISLKSPAESKPRLGEPFNDGRGFLLINESEVIQVQTVQEFVRKLGTSEKDSVKVVSIFGNTGEGKSHTLNNVFFGGKEMFRTSPSQTTCTLGVWAAYNPDLKVIVLDTEGLLGTSTNQNQRTRLLLKVLAISDVVIYRTRAERLHSDMYRFLSDASKAFNCHFKKELQAASERCKIEGPLSQLGPYVLVFHETQHTNVLKPDKHQDPADILRQGFHDQRCSNDAFSGLKYIGTKTQTTTDFSSLIKTMKKQIKQSDVRSFRSPTVIFQVLQMLNNKFSGHIENTIAEAFPDQYFTCSEKCRSCGSRCCNSTNHHLDNLPHDSMAKCKFQHQYQNRICICKVCYEKGETVVVVPKACSTTDSSWLGIAKYAWSGYIIECVNCGIIYQSRKYWYGNRDPNEILQTEIVHVWPGVLSSNNGSLNVGQKLLDSITYLSSTVSSVSAVPSKSVSSWVADCIAPSYWIPNAELKKCYLCGHHFDLTDNKHHCRSCGQGFCENCSNFNRPVPERGWGDKPVRVCKTCVDIQTILTEVKDVEEPNEQVVMARKVGEIFQSTLTTVAAVMEYPKGIIKDSARPSYWVPDEHMIECQLCLRAFTQKLTRHHCRSCGNGFCEDCSNFFRPVPERGWGEKSVRVCKNCIEGAEVDC